MERNSAANDYLWTTSFGVRLGAQTAMRIPWRRRDKTVREMGREEDKEQKVWDERTKAEGEERER